ncbi:MAG: 5-formyltetrahydrofolate cyclo-ligase [Clostridia bacterium]|nr:5-formyltetrahydrofolate cyclo-ligase [Clostridia bacterium]
MQNQAKEQKRALRAQCLAARAALPLKEKHALDAALCRVIAESAAFAHADLLLLFSPVRGEPDLTPLAALAVARGIPVAFPRTESKEMTFHIASPEDLTERDRFGIPVPYADAPLAHCTARTLCVLPGLAAGLDGTRLGYGGGFYDRFLATFKGSCLFPLYDFLVFPTLPFEDHDFRVAALVTEKGERTLHGSSHTRAPALPS